MDMVQETGIWQLAELTNAIKERDDFVLIAHISPDGDTIGSTLAMLAVLESVGKKACALCDGDPPENLLYWEGVKRLQKLSPKDVENAEAFRQKTAIAIDCADRERLGSAIALFDAASLSVVIDHHASNHGFGQINCIDSQAAATAEIVYKIATALHCPITPEIGAYLYIALVSDTGNFSYSNTSGDTLRLAGSLLDTGFDMPGLHQALFTQRGLDKTRYLGLCLSNFSMHCAGQVAFRVLTWEELVENGLAQVSGGGAIEFLRDIEGVEVAVLARQFANGKYKVSMRSKRSIDVNEISQSYNGGGHVRAAGFTFGGSEKELEKELIEKISDALAKAAGLLQ